MNICTDKHVVRERKVTHLFSVQHGSAHLKQIQEIGFSGNAIHQRVKAGRWYRPYPRVYSIISNFDDRKSALMAAVLGGGTDARLSGIHALRLYKGLRWQPNGRIDVAVSISRRPVHGIKFRKTIFENKAIFNRESNIPLVEFEQALIHAASSLSVGLVANIMHEGSYKQVFCPERLEELLINNTRFPGVGTIREALSMHYAGSSGTMSSLEDQVLKGIERFKLQKPEVGVLVEVGWDKPIRPDFVWKDKRVCVEVDGAPHLRKRTKREDRLRTIALKENGWRVLRFSGSEIDTNFENILWEIYGALIER